MTSMTAMDDHHHHHHRSLAQERDDSTGWVSPILAWTTLEGGGGGGGRAGKAREGSGIQGTTKGRRHDTLNHHQHLPRQHTPSTHLDLARGHESALRTISTLLLARPTSGEETRSDEGGTKRRHDASRDVSRDASLAFASSLGSALKKSHIPLDHIPTLDLDTLDRDPLDQDRREDGAGPSSGPASSSPPRRTSRRWLEDPISPSLLPGAWNWASRLGYQLRGPEDEDDDEKDEAGDKEDGLEDFALRLPPPFLDDSSSPDSFRHLFEQQQQNGRGIVSTQATLPGRGPLAVARRYIAASVQQHDQRRKASAPDARDLKAFLTRLLSHQREWRSAEARHVGLDRTADDSVRDKDDVFEGRAEIPESGERGDERERDTRMGQRQPPSAPLLKPLQTPSSEDGPDSFGKTTLLKPVLKSATSYTIPRPGLKKRVTMHDKEELIPSPPTRLGKSPARAAARLGSGPLQFLLFGQTSPTSPEMSYFKNVHFEPVDWSEHVSMLWQRLGGLVGISRLVLDFTLFVLGALLDSIVTLAFAIHSMYTLSSWIILNLTGRTNLSKAAAEYFNLIKVEWDRVAEEDHEGRRQSEARRRFRLQRLRRRGSQFARTLIGSSSTSPVLSPTDQPGSVAGSPSFDSRRKGLTLWQTFIGLVEWGCLQSVTKERWLAEGANLEKVNDELLAGSEGIDRDHEEELVVMSEGDQILEGILSPTKELPAMFQNWSGKPLDSGNERPRQAQASLISQIKRYARFSTSTYGLRTHILAPPTPLLTPGASRLPHVTYAHLTKTDPKAILHAVIQNPDSESDEKPPYAPTYYLIVDRIHHNIIVAFRGTQSLHDIIVDLSARNDDLVLPSLADSDKEETFRVHAGILRAARYLVDKEESPLYAKLRKALEDHPNFGLVLTGHSLGAAIASTVAVLLSSFRPAEQMPSPNERLENGKWLISPSSGLSPDRPIQAWTFAHPCTMDIPLSRRLALGSPELVTGIALGSDIICRMGSGQIRELRRVLGALTLRRKERHRGGKLIKRIVRKGELERESVLNAWWRWKRLGGGQSRWARDETDPKVAEIERDCWRLRQKIERDLFTSQGRQPLVNVLEDQSSLSASPERRDSLASSAGEEPDIGPLNLARQESQREDRLRDAMAQSEAVKSGEGKDLMIPPGKMYWLNRRQIHEKHSTHQSLPISAWDLYHVRDSKRFFALPWFETCLLDEHMPLTYEEGCSALGDSSER